MLVSIEKLAPSAAGPKGIFHYNLAVPVPGCARTYSGIFNGGWGHCAVLESVGHKGLIPLFKFLSRSTEGRGVIV